jgi:adenosylcobinamide kinase/adenosylcobinamide-phosphate guanylyltransferase
MRRKIGGACFRLAGPGRTRRNTLVNRGKIVLIGGGARSGKSALALAVGRKLGARRVFVATARTRDEEMRARVERHRKERAGEFDTVEEPMDLTLALRSLTACDVIVIDCITHWVSNLLLAGRTSEDVLQDVDTLVEALAERRYHTVLVTNEVGMSVHPETPLGRAFVEVAGLANQRLARAADDVYFSVMGAVLTIRESGKLPSLGVVR